MKRATVWYFTAYIPRQIGTASARLSILNDETGAKDELPLASVKGTFSFSRKKRNFSKN